MPPVLILHDPEMPYDARRLARLLGERIDGVRTEALWPHRLLPVARELIRRGGGQRVVHAFGRRALTLAALAANTRVLYSTRYWPTRTDVAWMRATLRYRDVTIVCTSDAERRRWVSGGVPMERCRLVRAGVSMSRDANARGRLGFGPSDVVVFTPLPAIGNARSSGVWTGTLLHLLNAEVRTLAWSDGGRSGSERLEALRGRLLSPETVTLLLDDDPSAGFAACDLVVLPPTDVVSPTLMAMAMASGRPIVASVTPQVCEMLEDRHTAMLTAGRTANALAHRTRDVLDDAAMARQIADRARAEAYEFYGVARLIKDYRTMYAGNDAGVRAADEPATPLAG